MELIEVNFDETRDSRVISAAARGGKGSATMWEGRMKFSPDTIMTVWPIVLYGDLEACFRSHDQVYRGM